ncbi:class B sortase [Erysipelothrix sp. HDW6C]|uniref:class B sortase n=1 Tax=Erysipelothrix sp. HDW6C TaxID=2714930 RepID=UPI00140C8D22|nr:class B sortase [Erysipelothrix sp. HDW6C]QIK69202.1 class B sortase [Erysipelothrix sp. HDW6C]
MKSQIKYAMLSCVVLLSATLSQAYPVIKETKRLEIKTIENKDYIGTLKVEGIFNEALYAPNDNEKYLFHNAEGLDDRHGELFLSANSGSVMGDFTLIYGHNNYDGSKFGNLSYLLGLDVIPDLIYEQEKETHTYAFLFAFEFEDGTSVLEQQLYGEQRMVYIETLKQRAIKSDHEQTTVGDIIFLQTCIGSYGDQRYVFAFTRVS